MGRADEIRTIKRHIGGAILDVQSLYGDEDVPVEDYPEAFQSILNKYAEAIYKNYEVRLKLRPKR